MLISIKVFPDAGKDAVLLDSKTDSKRFSVFVREPASQNRANRAVIRALAGHFDVPESRIRIEKGHKSMNKLVNVDIPE
ncbi:hypothetical protein A2997_00845 [Candidatus Nomurabacteria bacterium RIFCSPLOWO2_01_FULL_36_10b]|uniref:Uncharacterized protein n=1 Tax=Candidatus Nomurabacteria bacterium RIFCSPLOWO2_01_FULL_36_10b TaxID=1801766 RepID=A0A1F6WPZ3_9BACT|nr:MAG: hypothetical protein A2997_00845 [Candidatus Nomurabacteria bacterium RIFCSPLOWO2_01_FULL_36_10b]